MDRFDKQVKDALATSVAHIMFSRGQEVRSAVRQQVKRSGQRIPFIYKPIFAGIAACVLITSITLTSLVHVPTTHTVVEPHQVILAGDMPFAVVKHMMDE
ncbi:MAG: hypothetical protein PHU24_04460 [Sphaerochaetaceae bacterium]|jgi:hypothetical protein|nr:hypothetical protein [Sphaerochaetaceae bacterium]MDD2405688.1 hypothetical protein [Sphaerochaetaceae bacterium]MDD4260374.1 hypothetical protein [Sphaerochaetaceae bacterium]NLO60535.1 hypothetical protein [Spirochaetales bacterium]